MSKFNEAMLREMNASKRNDYQDNWDAMSRGPEPEPFGYPALARLLRFPRVFVFQRVVFMLPVSHPVGR